ncbi:MAG: anthranilate phosphoribosyltransferase [Alphaproteobacteria bacterium]|nr:anthranilate phosphoribosyltransferase [Alphaproteobacteria bacterium]
MAFNPVLKKVEAREDLSVDESRATFDRIFDGAVPAEEIGAFLLALHKKGETVDELRGAVAAMRSKMLTIKAPPGTMDIVGTGGDAHGTLNISTAVALVVAACGVSVAKHGNRAASSRSGSSDVLAALGINLDAEFSVLERCLAEANCCFLFAPRHHPALRHVTEVRRKLGVRTIFNLMGPLANPANVKRHLIGVYDLEWLGPMAETLKSLGSEAAWLVHGHDGMDEITTTDATDIVELRRGMMRHFTLEPEHIGLPRAQLQDLKGGDATQNAAVLQGFLRGEKTPYRDIVLFNAAAALIVAGKATDLRQGFAQAVEAVDDRKTEKILERLIKLTGQ